MRFLSPAEAAAALLQDKLVVLPTETVYGLAANAMSDAAVRNIFRAKGRPSDHPLIVHVLDLELAEQLGEFNEESRELARAFWPGPLTVVVPKKPNVPDAVTGGHPTVALRAPSHVVFQDVLRRCGLALAAPSANLFTELSPTTTNALNPKLLDFLAGVVEGGPCDVGLESAVVSASSGQFQVLRPGMVTAEEIARRTGIEPSQETSRQASPGTHDKHYQPRAKVVLVDRLETGQAGLALNPSGPNQIRMPLDAQGYARSLFSALANLDQHGITEIFVERPPFGPEWVAIHDRLQRAAG